MRPNTLRNLALAATLLLAPAPALAQPGPPPPPPDHPAAQKVFERLRVFRARILRERVGLPEPLAKKVEGILAGFDDQRRELHLRMRRGRRALRRLLRRDSNDQKAYRRAVDDIRAAQIGLDKLRIAEFDAIREHLTPKQEAKLLIALHRIGKRLNKILREVRKERRHHRRRGPPPPPD